MTDNGRTGFHYASSLTTGTSGGFLIPVVGTSASGIVRRVKVTNIIVCGTTAPRSVRFVGEGGPENDIRLKVATSENLVINFNEPYPLTTYSTTGQPRGIYGSASGTGVRVVVTGFVDQF